MPPAGCLCQHVRHPLSHFPNLASCSTVIADLFLCKKTKSDSFPLEADAEVSLPTMIISFGAGTSSPFMDSQILQNSWTSFQTLSSPHTLHWKSITGQMDAMPLQYRAVFFFQNTISPLWMSGLSLLNHSTVNRSCFCRFTSWGSERWNGGYCKKGSGGEKTSVRSESEMKCFSISDIDKKLISDIPNKNVCSCLTLSDLN